MPNTRDLSTYRPQWQSRIGFLFAAIGVAVGLGNIWRFPYIAYKNGGGAFLIPYLVALVTAGIPILMLEFALGHKEKGSAPKAFRAVGPAWEWVGWWSVIFIMFGIMGMFIGPIVAALFVTIWELYGVAFKDILPETGSVPSRPQAEDNDNSDQ